VTSAWTARYPDLTGKGVVIAADLRPILDVVRVLAANGALLAIVVEDRAVVDEAVQVAESLDVAVLGMSADPRSVEAWARLAPHIEQRLAPIDVAVGLGDAALRAAVTTALLPDMSARHRGVLIEVDRAVEPIEPPAGIRHRGIRCGPGSKDTDIAAAVLLCASDTVAAPSMLVTLD
jgi:hypothetical protein